MDEEQAVMKFDPLSNQGYPFSTISTLGRPSQNIITKLSVGASIL